MNWLRKIGNWLWLNKERMVLAVMVCILIFRVYQVLNPVAGPLDQRAFSPPRNEPPEESPVAPPPPLPSDPLGEDWSRLWRLSPFPYRQPRTGTGTGIPGSEESASEILLVLEQIRDAGDGTWRAKIRTASRATWYSAGEPFEQFTLMSIDPEKNCVEIFSEQEAKTLERCIE